MVAEAMPDGLVGVLMRVPQARGRTSCCSSGAIRAAHRTRKRRELAKAVGAPCARYLRETLKNEAPAKAATVVGLLSRLDAASVDELLPRRLREGGRGFHDAVVRQLSTAGAPERGKLLSEFARNVRRNDSAAGARRNRHVRRRGHRCEASAPCGRRTICRKAPEYLRVKAIEALGRMRAPAAAGHLRRFRRGAQNFWLGLPGRNSHGCRPGAREARSRVDASISSRNRAWIRKSFTRSARSDPRARLRAPSPLSPRASAAQRARGRSLRRKGNIPPRSACSAWMEVC